MSKEEKENKIIKNEKTERVIAILSWIIILLIVLYSGLYVGKIEREARIKEKEKNSIPKENILLDSSTDHERYVVRVYGFKDESETIDFISENLGFKYLKPIQIATGSSERCVDIGYFRSRKSAEQISEKYDKNKIKYQIYNYKDRDVIGFLKDDDKSSTPGVTIGATSEDSKIKSSDSKNIKDLSPKISSVNKKINTPKVSGSKIVSSKVAKVKKIKKKHLAQTSKNIKAEHIKAANNKAENIKTENKSRTVEKNLKSKTSIKKRFVKKVTQDSKMPSKAFKTMKTANKEPQGAYFRVKSHKKIDDPSVLKNMFTIQVLSLTNKESAQTILKKVEKAGYHAYLTDNGISAKRVYRIRIGAFKTRESALTAKNEVVKSLKEFSGGYVLHGVLKK